MYLQRESQTIAILKLLFTSPDSETLYQIIRRKRKAGYPWYVVPVDSQLWRVLAAQGQGFKGFRLRCRFGGQAKGFKPSRIQGLTLRDESRHRAIAAAGMEDPAGVELDQATVEGEERRAEELTIGMRSELIARTVHVKLFPLNFPFGMCQKHTSHSQ